MAIGRRGMLFGGVALLAAGGTTAALSGCNSGGGGTAPTPDDMSLGNANAPATLIEYASLTCPHCEEFEKTVFDQLKTNYIDTGKLHFILREFPAPAALAPIAVAEFQVARCGGADANTYFTRVNALFNQREAILGTGTMDGVRQKLIDFGASSNLSEAQIMACISDPAGAERVQRIVDAGVRDFNIQGTPTLILNGTKLEDPSAMTYAGLSHLIDAAIAAHH